MTLPPGPLDPPAGGGPVRVGQRLGTVDQPRLLEVRRHERRLRAARTWPRSQRSQLRVDVRLEPAHRRDRLARQVVRRGPEPAGRDHQVGATRGPRRNASATTSSRSGRAVDAAHLARPRALRSAARSPLLVSRVSPTSSSLPTDRISGAGDARRVTASRYPTALDLEGPARYVSNRPPRVLTSGPAAPERPRRADPGARNGPATARGREAAWPSSLPTTRTPAPT